MGLSRSKTPPLIAAAILALLAGCTSSYNKDSDSDGIPDVIDCDPQTPHVDHSDNNPNHCDCDSDGNATNRNCQGPGPSVTDAGSGPVPVDQTDAGFTPHEGEQRACGFKDPVTGTFFTKGLCRLGFQTFTNGAWTADCPGAVGPVAETCNGEDDDCDGAIDEDFHVGDTCSVAGECGSGHLECASATSSRCDVAPGGSKDKSSPELCDGKDNDCNGQTDEIFFVGVPCTAKGVCAATPGVYECDGAKAFRCSTAPGGSHDQSKPEVCDATLKDENCDGAVNEGCDCAPGSPPIVCGSSAVGECRKGAQTCQPNGKWGPCVGNIDPAPTDVCDGKDNDCDGVTDNGFGVGTSCTGIGACGTGKVECASATSTRCDVNPGGSHDKSSPELCDGKDNDCNGQTDETYFVGAPCTGKGQCGSGVLECATTATTRCSTAPGGSHDQSSPEVCDANLKDENCDGSSNENCQCAPGDVMPCGKSNVGECRMGSQTCQPNGKWGPCVGNIDPAPTDVCDGKDNDCDGVTDNGFGVGTSCTGIGACGTGKVECATATTTRCDVNPGGSRDKSSPELCDGKDNDCNGQTDDGYYVGAPCSAPGLCGSGKFECATTTATRCDVGPGGSRDKSKPETCDAASADEDCDGVSNESCACTPGSAPVSCGKSNAGQCRFGKQTCQSDGTLSVCVGNVDPVAELCNGLDDDCDGAIDNGFPVGQPCTAKGVCGTGVYECNGPNGVICNVAPGGSKDKSKPETCNGLDDDCNGSVDDGYFVGAPCQALGICGTGKLECASATTTRCDVAPGGSRDQSKPEVCDSSLKDENCNGSSNEGCGCTPGSPGIACGFGNKGECRLGTQTCKPDGTLGPCVGNVDPVAETCDGKDNDCDGVTDNGFGIGSTCNGVGSCGATLGKLECATATTTRCDVNPGGSRDQSRTETCNGRDDDCNGIVDDGYFVGAPCTGKGQCGSGVLECATASTTRCSTAPGGSHDQSSPEVCDANLKDENCDGSSNETCACRPGQPAASCGVSNVGACHYGTQACLANGTLAACVGNVDPVAETCNGKDDDCDGVTDNGFNVGASCTGVGACGAVAGKVECASASTTRCSTNPGGSNNQMQNEICDGLDNDCNGKVDDLPFVCTSLPGGSTGTQPPAATTVGNIDCAVDPANSALAIITVTGAVSYGLNAGPSGAPISPASIVSIDLGADNPDTWGNPGTNPRTLAKVNFTGNNVTYTFTGVVRLGPDSSIGGHNKFAPRVRDGSGSILSYFQILADWSSVTTATNICTRVCSGSGSSANCNIEIN